MVLAGGRRDPADVPVELEGDEAVGSQVLEHLAVTP